MPFKSKAQRRKFGELVSQGKMSKSTLDEWNKDTPHDIPERKGEKQVRSIDDLRETYKRRFPSG